MKRKLTLLMAVLTVLALVLGACAAKSESDRYYSFDQSPTAPGAAMDAPATDESWNGDYSDGQYSEVYDSLAGETKPTDMSEKMIYTADVTVETVDFDASVKAVEDMVRSYGAFFESTNVSDLSYSDSYYGGSVYRRASYVIRVPVARFSEMTDSISDVGHVVNTSSYARNITPQFYDTQSRRDAYGIEQERLLAMLEKCETVGEMIEIEARLSDVRYQIESLESTLRSWQNQVDYSTVNLTVREVEKFTEKEEPHRTYWQQIGDGVRNTLEGIADFSKGLFKDLVIALPVIALVAVFVAVVVVIVLRLRRRKARRSRALDADIEEDGTK